jgi:hypothetical protein
MANSPRVPSHHRCAPAKGPAQRPGRPIALGVSLLASLLLSLWFITQSGVTPQQPRAFFAVFQMIARSLPVLSAVWLGAAGYGWVLCRALRCGRPGGVVGQLGLGMAALLAVNWLLAWAGWLTPVTAWGLCGVGAVVYLAGLAWATVSKLCCLPGSCGVRVPWSVLLLVPGLALLLAAAACPPGTLWRVEAFGYDVMSYHLQLPREWIAAGRMAGFEHNVYSFLPGLIEAGYMLIGLLGGSVLNGVYTCQLFHVTLALLAAAAVGKTVAARAGTGAGVGAAALLLAVPWVTVTGSMAYNEMGVLAFGAVALMIAFDDVGSTRRGAAAVGLLVGAATLAKLTAGVMIAVPVGLVLLLGLNRASLAPNSNSPARKGRVDSPRSVGFQDTVDTTEPPPPGGGCRAEKSRRGGWWWNVQLAAIAALAGALMLSPYLERNYVETGNPVFPFAAERLGMGHWDKTLAERWDTAHGLSPKHEGKPDALGRQWLFNTGYGAIGGRPTPREMQNIARFDSEGGVPTLWIAVAVGGVLLLVRREMRRPALALLLMLAVQVVFWMFATHMQSRFLVPTVLPACLIAGLGYGRFRTLTAGRAPSVAPLMGSAVVVTLGLIGYTTMLTQTHTVADPDTGQRVQTPIWMAINTPLSNDDHPINRLPKDSKTLLVADNSGLLYLRRPIVYATAFDADPLGEMIRDAGEIGGAGGAGGDPVKVNEALRRAGITHVWVHWSELARLHHTYGHDRDVTEQTLSRLIATGWRPVETVGRSATLYALPHIAPGLPGAESQ